MELKDRFSLGGMTSTLSWVAPSVGLALFVLLPQACTKRLPHGGEDPIYPLRGLHAAVPCEGCHGEGTPKAQSTVCMDCHEEDRKDPSHHPGENCSPCHTEYGWDVGVVPTLTYTTGETGTPPTETGITAFDHTALPPEQKCWDCHEEERKDYPAITHYSDDEIAKRWDCGPCHGYTAWETDYYDHPVRSPHGTYKLGVIQAQPDWVVSCVSCHADTPDYTTYTCGECHLALEPAFYPHYLASGVGPGPYGDGSCLTPGCHEDGDL